MARKKYYLKKLTWSKKEKDWTVRQGYCYWCNNAPGTFGYRIDCPDNDNQYYRWARQGEHSKGKYKTLAQAKAAVQKYWETYYKKGLEPCRE